MIKEEVKHIFARSACLTRKQFEAYLAGNMITEEVYGVEHHINGCPLCSMAMDGMQLRKEALTVASSMNADFLKQQLETMQEPATTGAAAYVKNLKPANMSAKPLMTGLKIGVAIAACAGILWFVQSIGKNSKAEAQLTQAEPTATEVEQPEEGSVVVEQPLVADNQVPATTEPPVEETQLIEEAPATAPPPVEQKPVETLPPKKEEPKKEISNKPVTPVTAKTTPNTTTAKTPTTPAKKEEKKPALTTAKKEEKKPTTTPAKTEPVKTVTPPPPVKEVAKEQPKPQPEKQEEPKPAPKVEEPKPQPVAKKEEPAEELPSDPLAAGKALMEKRNYNAAINKMRNEMRSNNKNRRQEAVMMVARCYQAMGNKERAKELLSSIVDEGGPEKKNAKKMLKEVDKDAKTE